ncbi:hypothetical protein [Peterkaempfera bronchialis]|uniref:hypothetical protein n=1 Tax=Peterkaempfera bronchialis TaxID=2126346 RepID=UPI0013B3790B|nr:hypothetical protein [Peterkaempfera bronchialis]
MRRSSADQLRRRVPADATAGLPMQLASLDPDDRLIRICPAGAPGDAWSKQSDGAEVFVNGFERALQRATVLRCLEGGRWRRQCRGLA